MTKTTWTARARSVVMLALVGGIAGFGACAKEPPPSPDNAQPPVPNLAGLDVMVLPAQPGYGGVPAGFDEALSALLATEYATVNWILPADIERALARNRTLDIRPHALAVSILRSPDAERIGDPLYGDLRRLGSVVDARYALIVHQAAYVAPPPDSVDAQGRIELAAAIVDTIGGRILWRGMVASERGPAGDEVVLGTAVQRLARLIGPVQ